MPMGRYYFHIRSEAGLVEDEDGLELRDLPAVFEEAMRSAQEFYAEATEPTPMQFEISDDAGTIVLQVPVRRAAGVGH